MSNSLIDITLDDQAIVRQFRDLHEDFNVFAINRPDNLELELSKIIKFIVYCYDKEEDNTLSNPSWQKKKREAAILSGLINKASGEFVEGGRTVVFGLSAHINRIISRYCWMQSDKDFAMLRIYSEMLVNSTAQLLDNTFDNPSQAIKAKQYTEDLIKDISKLEKKILSGGDVKELEIEINRAARRFSVDELRPENIVTNIANGKDIVDEKPYGNDYKVEPQRFLNDE